MKIYDKAERLNDVSYAIRGPVMQEAQRMMANGISVLRLNIGNPAVYGFRAPKAVSGTANPRVFLPRAMLF